MNNYTKVVGLSVPFFIISMPSTIVQPIGFVALLIIASVSFSQYLIRFFKTRSTLVPIFVSSFILLIAITSTLSLLGLLNLTWVVAVCLEAVILIPKKLDLSFKISKQQALSIIAVLGVGTTLALLIHVFDPYPALLDTDVLKESVRIDYIARIGYSPLFLSPFSLDPRPIAYDSLFAFFSHLLNSPAYVLSYYWDFLAFPLFGVGVLLFSNQFLKDWYKSVIASVLTLAICDFRYEGLPFLMLPDILAIILTLYMLTFFLDQETVSAFKLIVFLFLLVFVDIGYYYAAVFVVPLIAFVCVWNFQKTSKPYLLFALLSTLAIPTLVIAYAIIDAAQIQVLTSTYLLFLSYTPLTIFFGLVGMASVMHYKMKTFYPLLIFAILSISLYLLPTEFGNRLESFARPVVPVLAAIGLFSILSVFWKQRPTPLYIYAFIILMIASPMLVYSYVSWASSTAPIPGQQGVTILTSSPDEEAAGLWLEQHYSNSSFIVSDIGTSVIMQTYSGMQGVLNPMTFFSNLTWLDQDYDILNSTSLAQITPILRSNLSYWSTFYFVYSTRTPLSMAEWRKSYGLDFNSVYLDVYVYQPQVAVSDPNFAFADSPPIYSNPSIEIYRVSI